MLIVQWNNNEANDTELSACNLREHVCGAGERLALVMTEVGEVGDHN